MDDNIWKYLLLLLFIIPVHKRKWGHYNKTSQINLRMMFSHFLPISPAEGVSVVIQPCILVVKEMICDPERRF